MSDKIEISFIFISVIIGVISAAYFYESSGIFLDSLKKPLRLIGGGMIIMASGVLLAALITYESSLGVNLYFYDIPLSAFFFAFYIIGSIMIGIGAKRFTKKPKPLGAAV